LKKRYKILGAILIVLILCGISFYAGGVIGFTEGYGEDAMTTAPIDAIQDVTILKAIKKGQLNFAISLLEMDLNARIMIDSVGRNCKASIFDTLGTRKMNINKIRKQIASYRQEYPSNASSNIITYTVKDSATDYEQK
jgi:hypothetical protein